jgi:hypothetical protein
MPIQNGWLQEYQNWIRNNKSVMIYIGILVVLLCLIFLQRFIANQLVNKNMGFEIKGPVGWYKNVARDKASVIFSKNKRDPESAFIRFTAERGNPYGYNALDYIVNGIIPQVQNTYGVGSAHKVQYRNEPFTEDINDLQWATVSFYLDFDHLHIIYVAMVNDMMYVLTLDTRGKNRKQDEKVFDKVLHEIKIHHMKYRNVFMETGTQN